MSQPALSYQIAALEREAVRLSFDTKVIGPLMLAKYLHGKADYFAENDRRYPPKAILGTACQLATGQRLASGDFEGGKTGAVRVLGELGFTIAFAPGSRAAARRRPP